MRWWLRQMANPRNPLPELHRQQIAPFAAQESGMKTSISTFLGIAILGVAALPAYADGEVDRLITQADRQRLDGYEATRAAALTKAKAGGEPVAYANLMATLQKPNVPINGLELTGDWQCRVTKAGGSVPLLVYTWFRCRVTDDGSGWMLEKLSGSQKTKGRFYTDSDTRLIYLGAGYVNDDPAPKYGAGPKSDQVGYAFATGPQEWRIEFPTPAYESKFDILELRR